MLQITLVWKKNIFSLSKVAVIKPVALIMRHFEVGLCINCRNSGNNCEVRLTRLMWNGKKITEWIFAFQSTWMSWQVTEWHSFVIQSLLSFIHPVNLTIFMCFEFFKCILYEIFIVMWKLILMQSSVWRYYM